MMGSPWAQALEDALEKRKAEMAERSRRSALLSATVADRRAALDGIAAATAAAPGDTTEEVKQQALGSCTWSLSADVC